MFSMFQMVVFMNDGIMCKIVQNGVKYYIGLMCDGVIRLLVGMKLLCLRNQLLKVGVKKMMKVVISRKKFMLIRFFIVQYGWNGMLLVGLSVFQWLFFGFFLIFMLLGLFEFILCSVVMCSIISSSSISGSVIMCNVKKWLSVVLVGMQLFMIYCISELLMQGMVLNSEMIILVFQNDILFYGSMQFMNVLVISIRKISMLRIYISLCGFLYELYIRLWNMCRNIMMKNSEVLVECMQWISQFYFMLCMMYLIEVNVLSVLVLQFMVRKMLVMIWLISINSVSELKQYQRLKFFGVQYLVMCLWYVGIMFGVCLLIQLFMWVNMLVISWFFLDLC